MAQRKKAAVMIRLERRRRKRVARMKQLCSTAMWALLFVLALAMGVYLGVITSGHHHG